MTEIVQIQGYRFANAREVYKWAKSVVGRPAPHDSQTVIKQVLKIDLDLDVNAYSATLLAEINHLQ
jgi:hypothetical protein